MPISKVLIVDDSPTERHFLGELLTKQGFQVIMAESGEEAMQAVARPTPASGRPAATPRGGCARRLAAAMFRRQSLASSSAI